MHSPPIKGWNHDTEQVSCDECKSVGNLLKTLVYFFRKLPGTFLTTSLNGLIHNLSRGYFSPSAQVQWPNTHLDLAGKWIITLKSWKFRQKSLHVKKKNWNTSTTFSTAFLLLSLIHFFIERSEWLDVMHLMYWLLASDQNWYCRNSNRICRYRSISSLTPKRSKETGNSSCLTNSELVFNW